MDDPSETEAIGGQSAPGPLEAHVERRGGACNVCALQLKPAAAHLQRLELLGVHNFCRCYAIKGRIQGDPRLHQVCIASGDSCALLLTLCFSMLQTYQAGNGPPPADLLYTAHLAVVLQPQAAVAERCDTQPLQGAKILAR